MREERRGGQASPGHLPWAGQHAASCPQGPGVGMICPLDSLCPCPLCRVVVGSLTPMALLMALY